MRRGSPGRRLRITLLCFAFALSIFAGRLVQLEGVDSATYRTASEQQQSQKIYIPAVRGDITASNGTVLAMTVQTYTVLRRPGADPGLGPVIARGQASQPARAPGGHGAAHDRLSVVA